MKNMAFLFVFCFLSLSALAETLSDRVHSVVRSSAGLLVRFEHGRVGFASGPLAEVLSHQTGSDLSVELDERHEIRQILRLSEKKASYEVYLKGLDAEEPPAFQPTVISLEKVNEIYQHMNPNFKRLSECSDRAHVWAWDEFQRSGTKSRKAFIFFTASYINRVRFKWWFHVAPMFDVATGDGVRPVITDVMYKDRPVSLKEWSNMMVFSGRDCKMTTKFSEYDVNPQTEDCYMIIESMYYRIPGDLSEQEIRGTYRSEWIESEVSAARSRAFNVGRIQ